MLSTISQVEVKNIQQATYKTSYPHFRRTSISWTNQQHDVRRRQAAVRPIQPRIIANSLESPCLLRVFHSAEPDLFNVLPVIYTGETPYDLTEGNCIKTIKTSLTLFGTGLVLITKAMVLFYGHVYHCFRWDIEKALARRWKRGCRNIWYSVERDEDVIVKLTTSIRPITIKLE